MKQPTMLLLLLLLFLSSDARRRIVILLGCYDVTTKHWYSCYCRADIPVHQLTMCDTFTTEFVSYYKS